MKIRDRLTLRFTALVGVLLLVVLSTIYFIAHQSVHQQFYQDLSERARIVSELYIRTAGIDSVTYKKYEEKLLEKLEGEVVQVFDEAGNNAIFEHNSQLNINREILKKIRQDSVYNYEVGKQQISGVYRKLKEGKYIIVVSALNRTGHKQLQWLLWVMVGIYIISLMVIVLVGRLFAINALSDIPRIVHQVRRISASNLHTRLSEGKGKDELAQLARTFNNMLNRLESSFEREKTFVNHASHEIRTPLTAMISQMDVFLSKERSNEEYRDVLRSILSDARQLNSMTSGLLSLAKLKAGEGKVKQDLIRLDELLEEACNVQLKEFPGALVAIHFNELPEDENKMNIHGDYNLLLVAFTNLIENAIKFSMPKPVTVTLDFAGNTPLVIIKDSGIGIPTEDLEKIYQPFYRSTTVMNIKGHGIGLAIVKTIFDLHRFHITFKSVVNEGTTVTIDCH